MILHASLIGLCAKLTCSVMFYWCTLLLCVQYTLGYVEEVACFVLELLLQLSSMVPKVIPNKLFHSIIPITCTT